MATINAQKLFKSAAAVNLKITHPSAWTDKD
jgi:hypothetical protein